MAIAIKNIPVLKEGVAIKFDSNVQTAIKNQVQQTVIYHKLKSNYLYFGILVRKVHVKSV